MKAKVIFLLIISILFISSSFAQDSRMEERTVKVNKGGMINIDLSVGDVDLNTWDRDEVQLKYDKDENSDFEISQVGSIVNISSSSDSWGNDLNVSLPSQFNIHIKTMGGDVKLRGTLKGEVNFFTAGGDIKAGNVNGNISLKTSGGDITTGEITGDADISTSGGDIILGKISGRADISTSGGNITMSGVGNSAKIKTAGGNVDVMDIGSDADIKTGGGNIEAKKINGHAILKTGGGNISLDGATGYTDAETGAGNIDIKNAGNNFKAVTGAGDVYVKLTSNIKGDCELKSGTGSIILYVPSNLKVTINAVVKSMGWGDEESSITSDFTASNSGVKKHGNQQTFNINGGGPTINVFAVLGSIQIKKI